MVSPLAKAEAVLPLPPQEERNRTANRQISKLFLFIDIN
ncbi:hypothetical protein BACUNI_04577 [Bacteroides uniformis ATCC 8492]|uniref:Uncharacterized protein n=1 Tax=Bacteroides uniformis (strain ATCC 8492 / DSM 6597 / CCUG 4942 / CIP 103695 / JCM 5828 / KCTC 5204 / NCTC 13054 / VPI 0061) TaxID=411479 RepID=A0ABC9N5Q6_BACUC|nr:hypothetical protein BACUNI_04577 [Bacteroides uniformis ATCC 8492]